MSRLAVVPLRAIGRSYRFPSSPSSPLRCPTPTRLGLAQANSIRFASTTPPPRPARPSQSSSSSSSSGPSSPPTLRSFLYSRATTLTFYIVSLASALAAGYILAPELNPANSPNSLGHQQYTLIDSKRAKELQLANQPRYGTHPEYLAAIAELSASWKAKGHEDRVSTDEADLETHGISDWSYHEAKMPTVVVWVESTEDVQEVVRVATKYRVPITPFSGGTSLEGHFSSVSASGPRG